MDVGSTLTLGTPSQVRAAARDMVRTIGPGGGHCLGHSNTVTNHVPLAEFRAMAEADLAYGHYPLDQASGYETGGDQETPC